MRIYVERNKYILTSRSAYFY